jgi:hypothetical protein
MQTATQDSPPRRPRGAPSLNPAGRPPVGRSLASAIRAGIPPAAIVSAARRIIESEPASPAVRARTLALLARRGYGDPARQSASAPAQVGVPAAEPEGDPPSRRRPRPVRPEIEGGPGLVPTELPGTSPPMPTEPTPAEPEAPPPGDNLYGWEI